LAAVSLVVMPVLSWLERRTGRELGSAGVVADFKQTLLCTYLSAVLVGLLLNATFDWTWADPIAALVIAGFAVKEGLEAWRGDSCSASPNALLTETNVDAVEGGATAAVNRTERATAPSHAAESGTNRRLIFMSVRHLEPSQQVENSELTALGRKPQDIRAGVR
jgi:Co/Zn/Cd efflux system component